jgi:hypothetical protein
MALACGNAYPRSPATAAAILRNEANRAGGKAHRSHFYQRATDRGFDVIGVVTRVFAVNLALAALALATILLPSRMMQFTALSLGAALVAWLLIVFARGPKRG